MSGEEGRRFTDREVAMILRDAAALDEERGGGGGARGLTLADLRGIAAEVGISPESVERAALRVDRRGRADGWSGAPLVQQAVRAVPRELDQTALARLLRVVDERAAGTGTVSEALGSVRWTADNRFSSTRVSVTPEKGRTSIQVVEKAQPRTRWVTHLIPTMYGAAFAAPLVGALDPGAAVVAGILAGGAALGTGVGRLVWNWTARRRRRRVQALAEELAAAASDDGG